MYEKPKLQRYGSFRELTQSGGNSGYDIWGLLINDDTSCRTDGRGICIQVTTHS